MGRKVPYDISKMERALLIKWWLSRGKTGKEQTYKGMEGRSVAERGHSR